MTWPQLVVEEQFIFFTHEQSCLALNRSQFWSAKCLGIAYAAAMIPERLTDAFVRYIMQNQKIADPLPLDFGHFPIEGRSGGV